MNQLKNIDKYSLQNTATMDGSIEERTDRDIFLQQNFNPHFSSSNNCGCSNGGVCNCTNCTCPNCSCPNKVNLTNTMYKSK
jgi:hypothetical protein